MKKRTAAQMKQQLLPTILNKYGQQIISSAKEGVVWAVSDDSGNPNGYTIQLVALSDPSVAADFLRERPDVAALIDGFRARGATSLLLNGSDGVTVLAFGSKTTSG